MNLSDTIVALSTATGLAAIAVIRLSGSRAIDISDLAFKGKGLDQQESHTAHYGHITDDDGEMIDEVVATLFIGPKSYTKQNTVEISCHGSPYIVEQIIKRLIQLGARPAEPGEFTLRAFMNGGLDLSQAEAVADLIATESSASHKLAIDQLRGGISNDIKSLRGQLVHIMSMLELELDFSEEDVEFADRSQLRELLNHIHTYVHELISSFALGNAIKNGVVTVLAGRPNAGKSTLLNALVNDDRAIVSEIAGTTRDTIEEVLNINGIQIRLIDTAGLREAQDQIEAIGVQKTLEKIGQSTLLIYVIDITQTNPLELIEDLKKLPTDNLKLLLAANKMDLNPYLKLDEYISEFLEKEDIIPLSAKNKMNIPYLKEKIYNTISSNPLSNDKTIVSNIRHVHALNNVASSIQSVYTGLDQQISSDLIAQDIRQILHYLGEITGEVTTDEILGHIFSKFCIGK